MIFGGSLLDSAMEILRETRQNIFDGIELEEAFFGGRLDDVAFLARLYDLTSMPSGVSETLCMRLSPCEFDGSLVEPFWI
jgi:hypothetical protein